MLTFVAGAIAGVCYLVATAMQVHKMLRGASYGPWIKLLGAGAVVAHAVSARQGFYEAGGINLGVYPMLSLMALAIVALVMLGSLRRPLDNLFILLFPIAVLTILPGMTLPGGYTPKVAIEGGIFIHIALSVVAYSLLTIAAAQALLLSFGDKMLRHHRFVVLRDLPPLETMERLMFEMLWAGLIFLTLSITSGFLFLKDFSEPGLVHHTAITLAAWMVFALLLWGRHQLGWRGAIASRWTLSGFVLLALGYFGSKVVLEFVLGRA